MLQWGMYVCMHLECATATAAVAAAPLPATAAVATAPLAADGAAAPTSVAAAAAAVAPALRGPDLGFMTLMP